MWLFADDTSPSSYNRLSPITLRAACGDLADAVISQAIRDVRAGIRRQSRPRHDRHRGTVPTWDVVGTALAFLLGAGDYADIREQWAALACQDPEYLGQVGRDLGEMLDLAQRNAEMHGSPEPEE